MLCLFLCLTFNVYAVGDDSLEKADMVREMGIGMEVD
jgi:hypothetical protein